MPPEQDAELDVRRLIGVLWRRAWIIVACVGVAMVVTYGYTARQPKQYAATAQVQIRDPNTAAISGTGAAPAANTAAREVSTQLEFVRSAEVRRGANDVLGVQASQVQSVSASNVTDTDIIEIRVVSGSPEVAQAGADAYATVYVAARQQQLVRAFEDQATERRAKADQLTSEISTIDTRLNVPASQLSSAERDTLMADRDSLVAQRTDLRGQATNLDIAAASRSGGVLIIEPASRPTSPFAPTPMRNTALAGVLGLLVGVALVFLLDRLDDRVASAGQLEALTATAVVGTIPVHGGRRRLGRRKLPEGERAIVPPDSPVAEAYRTLQTSIRFSSLGKSKQTLLITSSVSGEGKSTCTANLAAMLADSGLRVVVVSADLRKPMVASIFGVPETSRGLSSVLLGDVALVDCLVPVALDNGKTVYVLPAGPLPHNPTELLGSRAFGALLREIEEAGADFVLVDCAPVLPVSDPLAAAQHVDGVLVLTVAGQSKRANVSETIARLAKVQADVVGIVLNGVRPRDSGYDYYQQYGYGHADLDRGAGPTGGAAVNGSSNGSSRAAAGDAAAPR